MHAVRGPSQLESSGNRKPRQPISSPSPLIIEGGSRATEINPNAAAMTIQSGRVGIFKVMRARSRNVALGSPPRPVIHTRPYEIDAYATGMSQPSASHFGRVVQPIAFNDRAVTKVLMIAASPGHHI